MLVVRDLWNSIDLRRDARHAIHGLQTVADRTRIVGFVGKNALCAATSDQFQSRLTIVSLAYRDLKDDRQTERVDDKVDLRRGAASRATDRVCRRPPFPPAACWCARFTVESMMCHSASISVLSASKIRVQRPFFDQRSNRLKTVFQGPNSVGRSRQGAPARWNQRTASRKLRSSNAGRPRPRRLPWITNAILAHCSSVKRVRTDMTTLDQAFDLVSKFRQAEYEDRP